MKRVMQIAAKVLFGVMAAVGFFMIVGTAGTIDRLPAEQLPDWQLITQILIGFAIGFAGTRGLEHVLHARLERAV